MEFEKINNSRKSEIKGVESGKKVFLYPERASAGIASQIEFLHDIETGKVEKRELAEGEKAEVLQFEKGRGEKLEDIFLIKVNNDVFSLEYFLTEGGRQDFLEVTGEEFRADTLEEAKVFLYQKRDVLAKIDAKKRTKLGGNSKVFENKRVAKELMDNLSDTEKFSFDEVEMPQRVSLLYNPRDALEKIEKLRDFKNEIKEALVEFDSKSNQELSDKEYAEKGILQMYQRKVNEMIVSERSSVVGIYKMEETLGKDQLTEQENAVLNWHVGLKRGDKSLAKMDKFIYGASLEYNKEGERTQVNKEMLEFARTEREKSLQNGLNERAAVEEKGLDIDKIFDKNIPKEEFVACAEETLRSYDLLSSEDPEGYSEDRKGTAKDGKWQVIARSEYRSMQVNKKQKVVKIGIENKNIVDTLSVLIAHEIEGHVLQQENKERIPLKLFDKVGADRAAIFSEGGAMMNEGEVKKELFGIDKPAEPHYLAAMTKKLGGGNYLECVKAFYESAIKIPQMQKNLGKIDDESFGKLTKEKMALAVNRTERLFRGGANYDSKNAVLAKSKDTVYLEQAMLMRKLQELGMEKYAFLGGSNLRNLTFLAETGLVNLEDIQEPKDYAKEIWERIKSRYMANQKV
jgi:hypothetical protein